MLAGLTVYAVPQVLAATAPFGRQRPDRHPGEARPRADAWPGRAYASAFSTAASNTRLGIGRFIPWFILGFLAAMTLRSLDLIPPAGLAAAHTGAGLFTLLSMAALGLMVDVRVVMRSGGRVLAAGLLSLVVIALLGGGLALWAV